jgi:hypothetical protein
MNAILATKPAPEFVSIVHVKIFRVAMGWDARSPGKKIPGNRCRLPGISACA